MRRAHLRAGFHCAGRTMNVLHAGLMYCTWVGSTSDPHGCTDVSNKTTPLLVLLERRASRCGEPNPCCCNFHWCSLSLSLSPDHMRPWLGLLLSPHGSLRRLGSAPSRRTSPYLCAPCIPLSRWWGEAAPACRSAPFSFLSGRFCRGEEPPCSRCPCSSSGTTVAHTLASYWATLTTPSPAGYYVSIPSLPPPLPPSLPLIQQLPAGLVHTESP